MGTVGNMRISEAAKRAGTTFKEGESGNPNGRPKKGIALVNAELAERGFEPARKQDVEATYMAMLQLGESDLKAMALDTERPMLVRVLAKNMLGGKGFDIMERMLDRGVGKPTQKEEVTMSVNTELDEKRLAMVERLKALNKG